jgi:alpha-methylacyl-CoA racemase
MTEVVGVGPLTGVKVVELSGIGPAPFCGMLLSDMGAEVVRVERAEVVAGEQRAVNFSVVGRGRRSIGVDLKHPEGVECVLRIVEQADAFIEPFRPGVVERLGVGPDACLARNPRLVYGRMTGWGQSGPLARTAGHDIDYIAIAGVLAHIGRAGGRPVPPMNLVGDYGGGALYLAFGLVCGILEARASGHGQVIDVAMIDGSASLMAANWGYRASGGFAEELGTNMLDTGAPYYEVYETADARFVAFGAIEPQFYAELLRGLGLDAEELPKQNEKSSWPMMKERFAAIVKTKTRAEWREIFDGTDACVAPVLTMGEAASEPHVVERGTIVRDDDGLEQPAPAPRFSRTPGEIQGPTPRFGADTDAVLAEWGFGASEIAHLHEVGAVAQSAAIAAPASPAARGG